MKEQKPPETNDTKINNNVRNKKLSSASQRTLNRKRSQQHLDSQLRNDGDETEEDMLLNKDKNSRNVVLPELDAKHGIQTTNTNKISTNSVCPELQPVIDL